jgi:hypothetical protein
VKELVAESKQHRNCWVQMRQYRECDGMTMECVNDMMHRALPLVVGPSTAEWAASPLIVRQYCQLSHSKQPSNKDTLSIFHCQNWKLVRRRWECSSVTFWQTRILSSTICCLVSLSSVLCRSHLSTKERVKTQKDILPALRPCTANTSAYHYLKQEACNNFPSPLMIQSKKLIWKVRYFWRCLFMWDPVLGSSSFETSTLS